MFEQFEFRIRAIHDAREFVIQGARDAVKAAGITWEDAGSLITEYEKRCTALLRRFDYASLPGEVTWLQRALAAVDVQARPTDQARIDALDAVHTHANRVGWVSQESEALLRRVDNEPSRIGAITWDSAETDGRRIERQAVRESMRTAAYSDEAWQKYVETLPRIREERQV